MAGWSYQQSVYSAVLKPLSFMALWTTLTSFRLAQTNKGQEAIGPNITVDTLPMHLFMV